MAKQTAEIVPGEVNQEQWDAKYGTTTQPLKDLGGADSKDADDLPGGATNKYDTGPPPATTDELAEGVANKYDTGPPPSDLEELPDGATRKAMLDAEKTKLTGIDEGAEVNPADLAALDPTANTKLGGVEEGATADQTGAEVRDAIVAIAEADRKIVVTEPLPGEHKVYGVHRNAAGNLEYDFDDVPEE